MPFLTEKGKVNGVAKLMCDFGIRKKYVMDFRELSNALKHGCVLHKTRSGKKFKEKQWLRGCIDFNTGKREKVTNELEKSFYKAMNNIIFGKSIENVRDGIDSHEQGRLFETRTKTNDP